MGGCGFESQQRMMDGHIFALYCCKNVSSLFKEIKNNRKEAQDSPFYHKYDL